MIPDLLRIKGEGFMSEIKKKRSMLFNFFLKLKKMRQKINDRMSEHYSPIRLAFMSTVVCMIMMIIILFTSPYLGVANDSIANNKMSAYGLKYLEKDMVSDDENGDAFLSNEYFIKTYRIVHSDEQELSSQALIVSAAKGIDYLFTKDNLFDIRFLGGLYALLWLPGVFLILKSALERVSYFSEGIVLAVFGTLIFADVSYITYFNSLYPDALLYICMLYISGSALSLHKENKWNHMYLLILMVAGICLTFVSKKSFSAGIFLAFFCFLQIQFFKEYRSKLLLLMVVSVLLFSSVVSFFQGNEEFDITGKFHAMTRGVLLQSNDPSKTLENMDIDVSYSILTDYSLYDYYPVSEIGNQLLQDDFLDRYTTADIALYYIKHPGSMASMWDLGVKASFNLRRDYCSNYEKSVGMPPMSKSIFWSSWSIFKERSAPKTIGYLILIIIAIFIMSGKKIFNKHTLDRWNYIYFTLMMTLLFIGLGDITDVVIKSGDAQLVQFNMVLGIILDILSYFVLAEILHKLNILEAKNEEGK
jgi:hypothetical protein